MLEVVISSIKPLNADAMDKCQIRLDNLTKPFGSLHAFEHIARQIAGITGNPRPKNLKRSIILMAADNGVSAEGFVDSQEETAHIISNFCSGGAAINIFAEHVLADLVLVDIGVAADLPPFPQIRSKKISYGTKNIVHYPAMTRDEALQAIEVGIQVAHEQISNGVQVLGIGEMGIANIIPSIAIINCYSSKPLVDLIESDKIKLVKAALAVNSPDKNDPLDVLSKLGGLEIAGLVGVILGAASGGAAVVLDGLVTSVAALIAIKIAPRVKDYLIGSHFSGELAHKHVLDMIEIPAHLHLDMRLGGGTGAALGISLVIASLHVLNDMKTFGEAEVAVAQDGPGALKQNQDVRD